jgi:hypothetical protein
MKASEIRAVVNPNRTLVLGDGGHITDKLLREYDFVIFMVSVHGGGYHWLCCTSQGTTLPVPTTLLLFDTYDQHPRHNPFYTVDSVIPKRYKLERPKDYSGFQSTGTSVCGEYCVLFTEVCNGDIDQMKHLGFQSVSDIIHPDFRSTTIDNDKLCLKLFDQYKASLSK